MKEAATTLETTVTLSEILSGIVWARLSDDTKRVFAEVEEYAEGEGLTTALETLYRRLDSCTLEDALSAQMRFLEEDYLPELDPNQKNDISRINRTRNAINELDAVIDEIQEYEEAFSEECEIETPRVHAVEAPMRIGRHLPSSIKYNAYTVAIWAREELKIIISQWDDLTNYELFNPEFDAEPWIQEARIEARIKVLNALIAAALNAKIPKDSARIPKRCFTIDQHGLRLHRKKNRAQTYPILPKVTGFVDFMQWQFIRVSGRETEKLLSKDPPREILDQWKSDSPLTSEKVNLRRSALSECADLMIASLAIGLAEDEFAEKLKNVKPFQWSLPSALTNVQWDVIDGVSEATIRRLVQMSIDKMLKKAKAS